MSILTAPPNSYATSPHPPSQSMTAPHTWLRKQKQSNRTIFIFAISSPPRLPAAVFILCAFVLLPRVECPCPYPKLTNLPLVLGSPSLAFSRMLLLQFPRSLLHHGCLALFWIIPTCIQTISGISWPHIPPQLLLPFSPALTSHPAETGLCPALSPLISMLPNLMVKLLLLSHLIAQRHFIW